MPTAVEIIFNREFYARQFSSRINDCECEYVFCRRKPSRNGKSASDSIAFGGDVVLQARVPNETGMFLVARQPPLSFIREISWQPRPDIHVRENRFPHRFTRRFIQ